MEAAATAQPASTKRIAVFLDGTWNTLADNTNVWRLKSLCARQSSDGKEQVSYYNSGLGTKVGEKVRGGMFGYGINDAVMDAYEWLIEHYNTGDELFIFGFSRGAYTARSLSGLILKFGLLLPGAPLSISQLYSRYRLGGQARTIRTLLQKQKSGESGFNLEERWLLKYSLPIDVEFIGVWDTVGALRKSEIQFLNTGLRTANKSAFHALAIDEHRASFAPTLWTKDTPKVPDPDAPPPRPIEQAEQRWFVGAHANVGGGYQNDLLAQLPLKWLLEKAALHGLAFRAGVEPDGDVIESPVVDSYTPFMYGLYRLYTLGRPFYREIGQQPIVEQNSTRTTINETIDASVFQRWAKDELYRPRNLDDWAARYSVNPAEINDSVLAHNPKTVVR
ncbi:DUF2235 domain-containing protein [Bradyrhizobium sp. SZCCHNPS2010]|uniref:DUF2235 domain-containing protein n=1 Tax=Bradyrhizobium sp. SZCCHNPS2010 TaxID=3057333 RepID=UPI002915EC74|nr:DUF2235 domain-containing protein [Bradyrhizobium sp. SZCCHNPS2010]